MQAQVAPALACPCRCSRPAAAGGACSGAGAASGAANGGASGGASGAAPSAPSTGEPVADASGGEPEWRQAQVHGPRGSAATAPAGWIRPSTPSSSARGTCSCDALPVGDGQCRQRGGRQWRERDGRPCGNGTGGDSLLSRECHRSECTAESSLAPWPKSGLVRGCALLAAQLAQLFIVAVHVLHAAQFARSPSARVSEGGRHSGLADRRFELLLGDGVILHERRSWCQCEWSGFLAVQAAAADVLAQQPEGLRTEKKTTA